MDAGLRPRVDASTQRETPPPTDIGPPRRFQGGFTEVPLTPPGPTRYEVITGFMFGEPETTAGLFVDLDSDGRDEFVDIPEFLPFGPRTRRASVFRFDPATTWRLDEAATARMNWRVLAAADLDGDGFTDLVGDSTGLFVAWGTAQGPGDPVSLEPTEGGPYDRRLVSIALDDLDHDGWLDLFVGRNGCATSAGPLDVWLCVGARRFALRRDVLPTGPGVKPYLVGVAHPRPGETVLANFGGACSVDDRPRSFFREEGADAEGTPRFVGFNPLPDDPDFQPGSTDANLAHHIPMGASWSDLDNDGRFDVLITLDPLHTLFQGADRWPFREGTNNSGFSRLNGAEGRPLLPWTALTLDLDHDGREEVLHSHGNDLGGWQGPRFSPTQWITVHQNRGGLRFEEVPGGLGAAIPGQWRALVAADPDGDGDADLAVGGSGEHPRYLRNDIGPTSQNLSLRLVGTSSNGLGMGAMVEVPAHEDVVAQRFLVGGRWVSNVMPTPWVFASVGPSGRAPEVRITWPSGARQVLRDLPGGHAHRVVEPVLFTLAPSGRRQPAGEGSTFLLRVLPRREDGSIDAEAPVEVALLRGATRDPLRVQRVSEGWIAVIPASIEPTSARVEIRVGGVALGVTPRVWWDAR